MTQHSEKSSTVRELPELLAPAGDIETFFTVLEQGADAVYAGVEQFNARLRARNFSFDELARMTAYAHSINRHIYITLNTTVKDQELPELVEILDALRRIGPDALIIQDMGVWRLAREFAAGIPLHASTQMAVHNLDGAVQAERMGFDRVILARELTLEEIGEIRRGCTIELETFIHGAMCYSLSGQCNFSSYMHGKSANRGRCLQPCRRIYDAAGERKPFFATLDLNAAPILFQVIKAGVRSLKIEGRLKPAESLGQITAAYRVLLDAWPKLTKEVTREAKQRLRLAIGRKSSPGFYLSAVPGESMAGDGMSRSGIFLGRAAQARGNRFSLLSHEIIKVGDRVNVQKDRSRPPAGFRIRKMWAGDRVIKRSRSGETVTIEAPFPVETDSAVVKVIDADAAPAESRRGERKWPKAQTRAKAAWPARLRREPDTSLVLDIDHGRQGLTLVFWSAADTTLPAEAVIEILNRESPDHDVRIRVTADGTLHEDVPLDEAEAAAMQKEALDRLAAALDTERARLVKRLASVKRGKNKSSDSEMRIFRLNSLEEGRAVLQKDAAHHVIIPARQALHSDFGSLTADTGIRDRLILELPFTLFDSEDARQPLLDALQQADQACVRRFFIHNPAHFNLLQSFLHRKPEITAAESFHCMNRACLDAIQESGGSSVVFPLEGDRETLERMTAAAGPERLVVTLYGKVPLFRSRQPGPKKINRAAAVETSREKFLIMKRGGLIEVTPERNFSLRHLLPDLRAMGLRRFLYDLTGEEKPVKKMPHILRRHEQPDPARETAMNFERGLE
jgi:U32 family peptidase